MRLQAPGTLEAIQRGLHLPEARPTLVLVGSADPALTRIIERCAAQGAGSIDVRGEVAKIVVDNGLDFLQRVLDHVDSARHTEVRLAFAEPDANPDQLVAAALMAVGLDEWANRVERAVLQYRPPVYEVRYQPVIALRDRSVVGYESLLRAIADTTIIDAEELIARAIRGHWVGELDQLARTLALRGIGSWLGSGLLFLNVMAPNGAFDEVAVNATIDAALDAGLDADQLVLEAVERNRYTDLAAAARQIEGFRARGVRIAVDDVGDGYAGLRVLSAFSPDIVKIAGQLVTDLAPAGEPDLPRRPASDSMAHSVVGTVVEMAHRAGAWVVAENIETPRQLQVLTQLNVDWGQGLFLGAPSRRDPSALA